MKSKLLGTAVLSVGASVALCTFGLSTAHAQATAADGTSVTPTAPATASAPTAPPAPPPPPPAPPMPPAATAPPAMAPTAADAPDEDDDAPPPPRKHPRRRHHQDPTAGSNEEAQEDTQPGPKSVDEDDEDEGRAPTHHERLWKPKVEPFAAIVGGAKGDTVIDIPATHASGRVSAIMLADFGLRGQVNDWATFESEIMANGGPDLHGTSIYEGQAALQIRKQVLHIAKGRWMVEVGRVIDEASVDYFSSHVADVFLEDTATRDALLFDGFNLGNGIRGTVELIDGLRLGMAANAGNITSTSSVIAFGGEYAPYSRVFYQAAAGTRADLNGYPTDAFQSYVFSPSVLYKKQFVESFGLETHAELQYFFVDPNESDNNTNYLRGYNLRGNIAAHIFKNNVIQPFFNISYGRNDVVDQSDKTKISPNKYEAVAVGGGVDLNYQKKFGNYNGFGIQVMDDQSKVQTEHALSSTYYNIGTTYWLSHNIAAGARFALWKSSEKGQPDTGERSLLLTLRLTL